MSLSLRAKTLLASGHDGAFGHPLSFGLAVLSKRGALVPHGLSPRFSLDKGFRGSVHRESLGPGNDLARPPLEEARYL